MGTSQTAAQYLAQQLTLHLDQLILDELDALADAIAVERQRRLPPPQGRPSMDTLQPSLRSKTGADSRSETAL